MKKFIFVLIFLVSSCAPAPTEALLPTATSSVTTVPTATDTPTPQPASTSTLTPTPKLPVLAGTPFPQSRSVISQENVGNLTNIARWGTGKFIDADYVKDKNKLIVATASIISYYDTVQGILIWSKETPIFKVALSNSGQFLAVVTSSGIEVWDANNGSVVRKLEGISGSICPTRACYSRILEPGEIVVDQLDFSPDDKYLGVQVNEKLSYFWSMPTGDLLPAPSGKSFSFSHDSSLVAISTTHEVINIYKTTSFEEVLTLRLPNVNWNVPIDFVFSPDDSLIASVSSFGANQVFIWGIADGIVDNKISVSNYKDLSFIGNEHILISDNYGNRLIEIQNENQTKLPGDTRFNLGSIKVYDRAMSISEDRKLLALEVFESQRRCSDGYWQGCTNEVQVWDADKNELIQILPTEGEILGCQFSNDENFLTCLSSKKLAEWNITTGQISNEIPFGISLASTGVSFSSDATMLQAGNDIVEIISGRTLFSSDDCCIGFSGDSIPIRLDDTGDSIRIVDAQSGDILSILDTNPNGATYRLSPDGSHLGIERNRIIQFWRISNGKFISSAGGAVWWVNYNYSPDGRFVGVANIDGAVYIDVGIPIIIQDINGKLIIKLNGGLMDDSLAFSSDNRLVAISGYHNVKLFSFPDGQLIAEIGTSLSCRSMVFSISSDLLFCGLETGTIKILSISEKTLIQEIPAHSNEVTSLRLSLDGTLLGSGSSDGTTKLWAIYP